MRRLHPAWLVAAVAFVTLMGAAGFRSAPGVLMVPIEQETGWPRGLLGAAVSVNLLCYGLTAPFAAALMERFGIRRVTVVALLLITAGALLTVGMTAPWQLVLGWGVLIGGGCGSMALVFAATIANRWFVRHRGVVMGALTAAQATGQLVFLPVMAALSDRSGWRAATLVVAGAAVVVIPLVALFLRDDPRDVGVRPYGEEAPLAPDGPDLSPGQIHEDVTTAGPNAAVVALRALRTASGRASFWALAIGFAICGATTNGLVGTHFVPAAHDHGMPSTTAASVLALVGIFDILGTVASGYLTDRFDPRLLLAVYYVGRGVGLAALPSVLGRDVSGSLVLFIVVYGLDWVATVPPTSALCRELFGAQGTVVFGWVFAAHQIGAAVISTVAGVIRDRTGDYATAWLLGAGLCVVAGVLSARVAHRGPAH